MVSQLLFGEYYRVMSCQGNWMLINTLFDDYSGWIDMALFHGVTEKEGNEAVSGGSTVVDALFAVLSTPGQPSMLIPAGSELPGYCEQTGSLAAAAIPFTVHFPFERMGLHHPTPQVFIALRFLNTPYLWGGRSPVGFDCSGFIQVVFKITGIRLPRDAYQQAHEGREISSVKDLRKGDLAFFCNGQGQINHVGLLIDTGKIIHCSGYVRIDGLDETGIFRTATRQYTHHLCKLRRLAEF
jgi:hypothetical protein